MSKHIRYLKVFNTREIVDHLLIVRLEYEIWFYMTNKLELNNHLVLSAKIAEKDSTVQSDVQALLKPAES